MSIHWVKDLPGEDVMLVQHNANWPMPGPKGQPGIVVTDRATIERISDYSRSTPTSPSSGRVYVRRDWKATAPDRIEWLDKWWMYFVEQDPTPDVKPGCYHHPHEVLLVDA